MKTANRYGAAAWRNSNSNKLLSSSSSSLSSQHRWRHATNAAAANLFKFPINHRCIASAAARASPLPLSSSTHILRRGSPLHGLTGTTPPPPLDSPKSDLICGTRAICHPSVRRFSDTWAAPLSEEVRAPSQHGLRTHAEVPMNLIWSLVFGV
jgi:hypothetical protein